jgi:hypothetical protein
MQPDTLQERTHDSAEWSHGHANRDPKRAAECRHLCETLRQRIAEHRLPPDEAYWWTRIALTEASQLL